MIARLNANACVKKVREERRSARVGLPKQFYRLQRFLLRVVQGNEWSFFDTNEYMGLEQLGDRLIRFTGGASGVWRVLAIRSVRGETLPHVERVAVYRVSETAPLESRWTLSGVISNTRYVERPEEQELTLKQAPLSRSEATRAALIPIRKTAAWWNLTQEERRNVFENKSHHIAEGIRYLPSVARQLYHSRDIGEPFDFLTWFEYAPQHSEAFEELVRTLRNTEEWRYVDREIDIRLARD